MKATFTSASAGALASVPTTAIQANCARRTMAFRALVHGSRSVVADAGRMAMVISDSLGAAEAQLMGRLSQHKRRRRNLRSAYCTASISTRGVVTMLD